MKAKGNCANCGDQTHFATNAIGERDKMRWCGRCYRQREKYRRQDGAGNEYWRHPTNYMGQGAKTPDPKTGR